MDSDRIQERVAAGIRHLEPEFSAWDHAICNYIDDYRPPDLNGTVYGPPDSFHAAGKVLSTVLMAFSEMAAATDDWSAPEYSASPFGVHSTTESRKQGIRFELGLLVTQGFILSLQLPFPCKLARMSEEFWQLLASLNSLGKLSYEACTCYPAPANKDAKRIFARSKSAIFQLFIHYALLTLDDPLEAHELGSIEVVWPGTTEWPALIRNGAECFRRMHQMSVMLKTVNRRDK